MTTAQDIGTEPQKATPMDDANTLVIRRTLPAPPERVFAAFTQAELAKQWMGPGGYGVPEAEFDARVGGTYRVVMEGPENQTYSPSGVYEELVPNERLVFTWKWAHEDLVTRVIVELEPEGESQTRLTLTHTGFLDAEQRKSHEEGWTGSLEKMDSMLT